MGGACEPGKAASSMKATEENFFWQILPEKGARTGVPFFIIAKRKSLASTNDVHPVALLSALSANTGMRLPVELVLELADTGEWMKEFTVMLPGDYQIQFGHETRTLHVEPQKFLEFGREFGIFSGAVVLLVGGMILWLCKRKRSIRVDSAGST